MNDAVFMRVLDGAGERFQKCCGLVRAGRGATKPAVERTSVQVFQDQKQAAIQVTRLVDLDYVGMLELGNGPHFGPKSIHDFCTDGRGIADPFQSDGPFRVFLAGLEEYAAATAVQLTKDLEPR